MALPARAQDSWSTPYPGVRMLRRVTAQPVVLYALVVDSCAPGVRFRATAPSEGPSRTSTFGRRVGAQMAINGDFADHDFGLNVGNGTRWSSPDTDHSGNFSVGPNRIEMFPDYQVLAAPPPWATEQLGGRWTLIHDGAPQRGIDDNGPAPGGFVCAPGLRHPRTAIGLTRNRQNAIILVADGRSSRSIGMTCDEMIDVFTELGAHWAMGLDGGGSSTLWRNDVLVNQPSDATGERTVRNHLAIFATGSGAAPHCGNRPVVTEPPSAAAVPSPALPTIAPLAAPSRFTAVNPVRLFDTRSAAESARLVRGDGSSAGPLSVASGGAFRAWSEVGVAPDATAAWLNLTAVSATTAGFATVYPEGPTRPFASSINFVPAAAVANAAPSALGAARSVRFDTSTTVELIADLTGVFRSTGAGLDPIAPTRVLDTRATSMPLLANEPRSIDVRAPAGSTAVSATLTVVARAADGFVVTYPCGAPRPNTSSVNFTAGSVVANAVLSGLGAGRLCVVSSVDTDVIVDVNGYLGPSGRLAFVPIVPQRILDTREATTFYTGRVAERQVLELPLSRLPSIPASLGAAVVNVTVVDAAAPGFVTVFPCGTAPDTSSLNYVASRATSALTTSATTAGSLCLGSSARAHVIVDLVGVWVTPPASMPDAGVSAPDASLPDVTTRDVTTVFDVEPDRVAPRDAAPDEPRAITDARIGAEPSPRETSACQCRSTPTRGRAPSRSALLAIVSIASIAVWSARRFATRKRVA